MKRTAKFVSLLMVLSMIFCMFATFSVTASAEEPDGISFYGATLLYENEIKIRYLFTINGTATEKGVKVWSEDPVDPKTTTVEPAQTLTLTDNGGYWVADTAGIPAKEMGDVQYAAAYAVIDGTTYWTDVTAYSPRIYAQHIKDGAYVLASKNAVAALMFYGAAAQTYFNYKTDDLMSKGFTAPATVSVWNNKKYTTKAPEAKNGLGFYGASMLFEGEISYKFICTADDIPEGATLYLNYGADNAVEMTKNGPYYQAILPALAAKDLNTVYTVTPYYMNDSTKVEGPSLTYSAMHYAKSMNSSTNKAAKDLALAMAEYFFYAKEILPVHGEKSVATLEFSNWNSVTSSNIQNYTSSWTVENANGTWNIKNFNNNNRGWKFIKGGYKTAASNASIITPVIANAVNKIEVAIDTIITAKVTSISVQVLNSDDTVVVDGAIYVEVPNDPGVLTIHVINSVENCKYKINFECDKGADNGLVWISKVECFAAATCTVHTYGEWTIDADATCKDTGIKHQYCTVCGFENIEEIPVDPTAHDYEWVNDDPSGHYGECKICGNKVEGEHNTDGKDGACVCGYKAGTTTPTVVATFDCGNGTAGATAHMDGSSATTYTETSGDYTLSLTMTNGYTAANDAKLNGCIKLGTGKNAGGFKFTVPDNVTTVKIYIAKYKTNAATITVNEETTELTKNSNDGKYDVIEVDVSSNKTVKLEVSYGLRAMVDKIEYVA